MKLITLTCAAMAVSSYAASAHSQDSDTQRNGAEDSGVYAAIGGVMYNPDLYGVEGTVGYNFNKYFGVEAQGSVGLNTDSDRLCDSPTCASLSEKIDYSIGAFGVARLPLTKQLDIFARAGLHKTEASGSINNALMTNFDRTETSYAVGAGAQYNFNPKNGVRAEYTYLGGLDGGKVSVGYVRKF